MKASTGPVNKTIGIVNELLPGASSVASYSIGMACTACWQAGLQPDRNLLETMKRQSFLATSDIIIRRFIEKARECAA